jgi:hypothetical protein
LSDGTAVRLPGLRTSPKATAQDIRNVATALVLLVDKLDKRITELEKRQSETVVTASSRQESGTH